MKRMISVEEAVALIAAHLPAPRQERVPLWLASGRVLAETLYAASDLPRFANSAMDGYAVRQADVRGASSSAPVELPLAGEIAAGGSAGIDWPAGTCLRILTGAPAPASADGVIPVEETEPAGDGPRVRFLADLEKTGSNLRPAGEDMRTGEPMIEAGRRLGAPEIALLAMQGHADVAVGARPAVAFAATGDELVAVGEELAPGQIYNSNGPLVDAMIRERGYPCFDCGVAPDTLAGLRDVLEEALAGSDVLVTSGGISAGSYDLVGDALVALGAQWHFHKIAQQPGKPLAFMTWNGKPVFCLPGNPVSTLVSTWFYLLPALARMEGDAAPGPLRVRATLGGPIAGKPEKFFFGRAQTEWREGGWVAEPRPPHGSHILGSLTRSNSFLLLPPGTGELAAGEIVEVAFFRAPACHAGQSPG